MEEVRIAMPELDQQSDFVREERLKLDSAWHELANQTSGLSQTAKPLIQRVSPVIRRLKVGLIDYFEPVQLALGPLHHGKEKFKLAEQTKRKLAALFVHKHKKTDEDPFDLIRAEIKDLRKCYNQEDIKDYDDDKLAWMFFVDGCALLTALYFRYGRYDHGPNIWEIYPSDLLLLENQLPYRVLMILIESTRYPELWENSITDFIDGNLLSTYGQRSQDKEGEEERRDYAHLLERIRTKLLTGEVEKSSRSMFGSMILQCSKYDRKDWKTFNGIKELKQSGISVRPSKTDNLKDISFHFSLPGCLKMPILRVDDSTASKFMNLVALERCPGFKSNLEVTTYLCFLGSLIQTEEDVKELRVTGMLHNYLGNDKEVADLFRRISRDLKPNYGMYGHVTANINRYCNIGVIRIYSRYFSSNWSFLGFSGAVAGLVLTLIQAYCSIKKTLNI